MTNSSRLERRYRSLLALYPKAFRREHEQEILSVLMAAAAEGQKRPRLAESGDLVGSAAGTGSDTASLYRLPPDPLSRARVRSRATRTNLTTRRRGRRLSD